MNSRSDNCHFSRVECTSYSEIYSKQGGPHVHTSEGISECAATQEGQVQKHLLRELRLGDASAKCIVSLLLFSSARSDEPALKCTSKWNLANADSLFQEIRCALWLLVEFESMPVILRVYSDHSTMGIANSPRTPRAPCAKFAELSCTFKLGSASTNQEAISSPDLVPHRTANGKGQY